MNRLSFTHLGPEEWRLDGDAVGEEGRHFADLASAVAFARKATNAAEALVELRIDGFYACVHQNPGWQHPICAPAKVASYADPRRPMSRRQKPWGQSILSIAR
jgi:hypothetical protein